MNINKEYSNISRKYGNYRGFFIFLFFCIHKVAEFIVRFYCKKCIPVNNELVLFRSTPDFSDNARALAEYLAENGYLNRYTVYFDVEHPQYYSHQNYGNQIHFFSSKNTNGSYKLKSLKLLYTAHYLMSTHEMILNRYMGRKNQHFIRLWHGCGYKDRSSRDGKAKRNFDIALVPGPLFVKTKAYFWNVDEKYIVAKGYPRYDWLIKRDEAAIRMLLSLKINNDSKVVVWMPTYRIDKNGRYNDTKELINFPIVQDKQSWYLLDEECKNNNVLILVKLHPFQKEYDIPFGNMSFIKEISNSDFEDKGIQLYSILALTDALLTDYSSVAFDYLLVDKPIGYTLDDYQEYKDSRGFIFENPLDYMPGHHLFSFKDLMGFISDISDNRDPYKSSRYNVRQIAISSSNHYCKDILDYLGIV